MQTKYQHFYVDFESSECDSVVVLSLGRLSESPTPRLHCEDAMEWDLGIGIFASILVDFEEIEGSHFETRFKDIVVKG